MHPGNALPVQKWQSLDPALDQEDNEPLSARTANRPPQFAPSMRSVIEYPREEIEIAPPPQKPNIPTSSFVMVILPLLGLVLMAVISIFVVRNGNTSFLFMSAPLMLASAGGGIFNFFNQKKKYNDLLAERDKVYANYLAGCSRSLEALRQEQLQASLTPNPDPAGCLERARLVDPNRRLWERSPLDQDFLDVRAGHGTLPATYSIKYTISANDKIVQDPLSKKGEEVVKEYASVDGAAMTLPLASLGVMGCTGSRAQIQQTGRSLLLQIAAHHPPTEVKLVLIFPEYERNEWQWARWLPHIWNDEGNRRMLAANPAEAADLLAALSTEFSRRQLEVQKSSTSERMSFLPHYVFVFADPAVIDEANESRYSKLFAMLMADGNSIGAATILFQDSRQKLDRACRAVIDLKGHPNVYVAEPRPEKRVFIPDVTTVDTADRFARALAPLQLKMRSRDQERGSNIPRQVNMFDLLGIYRPEDLPVARFWSRGRSIVPLAGPIGVQAEGLTIFNLQEGAEHGFGPHAVVGGMTGTGKTKGLLHTLILSLAIHNHPHDLNFLLIDYKGGDLYQGLENLPHVAGYLGNLEGARKQGAFVRRLFICLEAELKRRRNLLGSASINDFHREQRTLGRNPDVILPHLVVVIDEFAELISKNTPDVVDFLRSNLVSIARTGRSLGVHLLLATQDPGMVVRGDIRDAINLIICLGMGTRDASNELLETEDAYIENLGKHMGRAYFKAKRENLYAQFQVAYCGEKTDYQPAESDQPVFSIREVDLNGASHLSQPPRSSAAAGRETTPVLRTQKEALAFWLAKYAHQQGITRLPNPFLPLLPDHIELQDLRPAGQGWDGRRWLPGDHNLQPLVGMADDPTNLAQPPLRLDLGQEGHLAVYGVNNAEVTEFLNTLVLSLALDHSPERLHVYILDYEGQRLNVLRSLPHVGEVVFSDENERTIRMVGFLQRELKQRKERVGLSGAASFAELQAGLADPFPELVLVLNNYSQLDASSEAAVELLAQLLDQSAAQYGIHLVVTANRSNAIPKRITNLIKLAIALELNPSDDLSLVMGGRLSGLASTSGVSGRGVVRGNPPLEFQSAAVNARDLAAEIGQSWDGESAPPVPVLRDSIALNELLAEFKIPTRTLPSVPLGVNTNTLDPLAVDLKKGPFHLVVGQPQSGKTTFIQTWLLALASSLGPQAIRFYFANLGPKSQRLYILRNLPHTAAFADSERSLAEMIATLADEVAARREAFENAVQHATDLIDEDQFMAQYPALVLVLDDYDQTVKAIQDRALVPSLESLLRQGNGYGLYGLLSAPLKDVQTGMSGDLVVRRFRECQTGVLFDHSDQNNIFSYSSPRNLAGSLPPGRGFIVVKAIYQPFHAAWASADGSALGEWFEKINQQWAA
ncbi:MAG: FtsK/SpoIIIE domain-containing protein [Anaerolineaceae bacterium]|nr:FtsK/SpoIIIE domain-containing protein [Anaerolineaceae bacterium]